jgi:hypothetical protein
VIRQRIVKIRLLIGFGRDEVQDHVPKLKWMAPRGHPSVVQQ